eukprot:TRINITY_DN73797_c0_g1_i1.p2 TRINITY_DN73797_c0_g1~~TRINITY_DN73797_c0_g1_i1.p2  ORF type:complete len:111 (+),score=26.52 TRINITY_DN73797_c0_g1_i1:93-425(+)
MATAPEGTTRIWVQSRGTVPIPSTKTSVFVREWDTIDDLKRIVKAEVAPLLEHVPKPAVNFYVYNRLADDYIPQPITRRVLDNPLPEAFSEAPGVTFDHPLFFDFDVKQE